MLSADDQPQLPVVPIDADELTTLASFLDYFRAVLARKAWGLQDEQLRLALAPSNLTLGGLINHMALVEDSWFSYRVGAEMLEPWASAPWDRDPDWEMTSAQELGGDELMARFNAAVARSRALVEGAESLDQLAQVPAPSGDSVSLRWIMVHMIEEYARHCGHADYLRQSIDTTTGD